MATIEYTARRSAAAGHVINLRYIVNLEIVDANCSVQLVREMPRSPGGAVEPCFERQDFFWTVSFAPVVGFDLSLLREFMDSTESGETFRIWLRPEDAAPLILKRLDDGHTERAFIRRGSKDSDAFTGEFIALQVGRYDPSGSGGEGGAGGYAGGGGGGTGGDSESTDIYGSDSSGGLTNTATVETSFTVGSFIDQDDTAFVGGFPDGGLYADIDYQGYEYGFSTSTPSQITLSGPRGETNYFLFMVYQRTVGSNHVVGVVMNTNNGQATLPEQDDFISVKLDFGSGPITFRAVDATRFSQLVDDSLAPNGFGLWEWNYSYTLPDPCNGSVVQAA